MSKNVLITGVSGFTGRYMSAELKRAGYEIFGVAHRKLSNDERSAELAEVFVSDLSSVMELTKIIDEVQPDFVVHLAAISFVAHRDIDAIYHTNLLGTRNLLEALKHSQKNVQAILLTSSANIYGNAVEGVIDEATIPAPANDYAVSKLAMEQVAHLYDQHLPIIIVRPFNYTGIGQAESFLLPKIVSHIKQGAPVIELGNLNVARDFSDVRMVVQYYRRLLENPAAIGQAINVCSGRAYTLNDILTMVRDISGHDFGVRVNPQFVRENEVKLLLGSRVKLDSIVGQIAPIPLQDTLKWMLEVA